MREVSLLLFLALLVSPVIAQTASNLDATAEDWEGGQDNFVLGRSATSTFSYEINDPYVPVDTALVIDESGSMSGVMEDAKDGAKGYVDNTNTAQGDQNAVVEFESSASTIQSLTGDKQDAKDAIDTITDGGGTDLPAGVSEGADALSSGSNPQQVMIVLADGGGGDPGTEADDARSDGIEVHGIMYGSGASTSEFESLTGASDCTTSSSENGDGDKCWYAESGTIDEVYNSIRESTEVETDVELGMTLRDFAYEEDSYDSYSDLSGNDQRFIRTYSDVEDGTYSKTFQWRSTQYGNRRIVTGNSYLELQTPSGSSQYDFTDALNRDIGYVDFEITDYTVDRDSSDVEVEVELANNGDVDSLAPSETSRPRELWVTDSSVHVSKEIPGIASGGSENITFNIDNSHPVVDGNNIQNLGLRADAQGYWDGLASETAVGDAEGEALEPNEDNNIVEADYPPNIRDIQISDISGQHAFSVEALADMETSESDFGECRMDFTNLDNGNEFPSSGKIEGELTQDGTNNAVCSYDNFNSSVSGFGVEDEVEVNVTIENDEGSKFWGTETHEIINRPPTIDVVGPKGGESVLTETPDLTVEVTDPEGDDFERIMFRDDVSGDVIADLNPPPQQFEYSRFWGPLDLGTYYWEVEAWDQWDSRTVNNIEFERVISTVYTVQNEIDYEYSSLIIEDSGQGFFFFESDVETNNRTVTTYLRGDNLDAEFVDSGLSQKTYEVDTGDPERFQVKVEGDQTGEHELRIITEDNTVSTNDTVTFPVYVRDSVSEGAEVPGLTYPFLAIIFVITSILYFFYP